MSDGTMASAAASTPPVSAPTITGLEVTASFRPGATARDVLDVIGACGCPFCKQPVGKYCRDPRDGRISRVHCTRVKAAQRRAKRGGR